METKDSQASCVKLWSLCGFRAPGQTLWGLTAEGAAPALSRRTPRGGLRKQTQRMDSTELPGAASAQLGQARVGGPAQRAFHSRPGKLAGRQPGRDARKSWLMAGRRSAPAAPSGQHRPPWGPHFAAADAAWGPGDPLTGGVRVVIKANAPSRWTRAAEGLRAAEGVRGGG